MPDIDQLYERDKRFVLEVMDYVEQWERRRFSREGAVFSLAALMSETIAGLEAKEAATSFTLLRDMKALVAEVLQMVADLPPDAVAAVDDRLKRQGLPLLSAYLTGHVERIKRVLSRGVIEDEADYYLLLEQLNDVSTESLVDARRELAADMIAHYEQRRTEDISEV